MRKLSMTAILAAALALVLRRCQGSQRREGDIGEKGEPGPAGPPGEKGEKGEKGDTGTPGTTLRVVSPQLSIASCETDEIMISAYCSGTFNAYPLVPLANGARCGQQSAFDDAAQIVCVKR
jgi:Collagen triple helix repeat (20 copies)